jgi:hypothetical protein
MSYIFDHVTWETSTIRAWLDGCAANPRSDSFLGSTFVANARGAIADTTVSSQHNPIYGAPGGNSA